MLSPAVTSQSRNSASRRFFNKKGGEEDVLDSRMDLLCNGDENRRVSMALDDTDNEMNTQSQSLQQESQSQSQNEASETDQYTTGSIERELLVQGVETDLLNREDPHKQRDVTSLSELTFKGLVIGGTYQHCFEDMAPVVAPPSGSDKRVTGASFSHNQSLELKLYLPKDEHTKIISLGEEWKWIATSPDGYLVSKGPITHRKKLVCYYLPRHPVEWANDSEREGGRGFGKRPSTLDFNFGAMSGMHLGMGPYNSMAVSEKEVRVSGRDRFSNRLSDRVSVRDSKG